MDIWNCGAAWNCCSKAKPHFQNHLPKPSPSFSLCPMNPHIWLDQWHVHHVHTHTHTHTAGDVAAPCGRRPGVYFKSTQSLPIILSIAYQFFSLFFFCFFNSVLPYKFKAYIFQGALLISNLISTRKGGKKSNILQVHYFAPTGQAQITNKS